MKGRFLRKACAAALAVMIVSGTVPSDVGTGLFDSFTVHADEVSASGTVTITNKNKKYSQEFDKDAAGNVLIQSESDWNKLADAVINDCTCEGYTFLMTKDLSVTRPIGRQTGSGKDSRKRFAGTFDGGGKTLNVDLDSDNETNFPFNKGYAAPFAYVSKVTIKNLHVTGKVRATGQWASGLIGSSGANTANGKCTIDKVQVSVTIDNEYVTVDNKDFANHGGFIGIAEGTATITDSWFDGSFVGLDYQHSGGFIGLNKTEKNAPTTLTNCLFDPSPIAATLNVKDACEFVHASAAKYVYNMDKCYSVHLFGEPKNAQGIHVKKSVSEDDLYTTVKAADGKDYYIVYSNKAWPGLQEVFANSESLKLQKDYTAGSDNTALIIPDGKTFTLDLNGHTIDRGLYLETAKEDGYVIKVGKGSTLTITDTVGTGSIVGGNNTGNGGGIYNEGTLMIKSGCIGSADTDQGNITNGKGGGIYNEGTLTLEGGVITGNVSTGDGGGVYVNSNSSFNVNGKVTITDNKYSNIQKNVFLTGNSVININGNLEDSVIGVTKNGSSKITKGLSGNGTIANFINDKTNYEIRTADGEASIAQLFNVTEGTVSNGKISVDHAKAAKGDTVKVTVTPDKYFHIKGVYRTEIINKVETKTEITLKNGEYSFEMPNRNVTVTAEFEDNGAQTVTFSGVTDGAVSKTYGDIPFTQIATAPGDITYSSDNEAVATVADDGTVTILGKGEATITAEAKATDDLREGFASYTLTVSAKGLTITGLSAKSKEYDGTTDAAIDNSKAALDGIVGEDDVTIDSKNAAAAFADKNVGNGKTVTFSGYTLSGTKAENYTLAAQPASVTANITAKSVTIIGMTAASRDYIKGDKTVTLLGGTVEGAVSGETLTVDLTSAQGTMADENVGVDKEVTVSGVALIGDTKDNYAVVQPTYVKATVSQAVWENRTTKVNAVLGKNGTADLTALIDEGCTAGDITTADSGSIFSSSPVLSGGKLSFKLADDSTKVNMTASVNIPVYCSNYKYSIEVAVTAVNAPKIDSNDEKKVTWDTPDNKSSIVVKDDTTALTVKDDGSVEVEHGSVTIDDKNTSTANTVITPAGGGKATLKPDADDFSKVEVTGIGSQIDLGSGNKVTLEANETAYISEDGENVRVVDSTGNTKYYEKDSRTEIDMPSDASPKDESGQPVTVMGIKVDGDVAESSNSLSDEEKNAIKGLNPKRQILSVRALLSNRTLNHLNFAKPITVHVPLSSVWNDLSDSDLNKLKLWYIDGSILRPIDSSNYSIASRTLIYSSDHLSDWIASTEGTYTITVINPTEGSITSPITGNKADANDEVTVSVDTPSGYRHTLIVKDKDGNTVPVSNDKFRMPASDVTITASFSKIGGSHIEYTETFIDGVGYRVYSDHVGVYEGDKNIENVVIKSEVEGKPVTTIEAGAFNSFRKIKTITLPDSLTTIEQGAFWGCESLEEIDIPKSVTTIEGSAFSNCKNLKKVIVRNKDCSIAMYNNTLYNGSRSGRYYYNGVVSGYNGSTAKNYASKFKYTFEDIEKAAVTTTAVSGTTTAAATVTTTTTTAVTAVLGKVNDPKIANDGRITWSKAENASEYKVVKVIGDKKYYGYKVAHSFYYFDSIPNEDYQLYVLAYGDDGSFTTGKTLSVKVNTVGKAAAPSVDKDGNVKWKAVKNAVKYRVVKVVNGISYSGNETTDASYTFKSVPASDYQVYVVSYGENGANTIGAKKTVKADKPLGHVNDIKVSADGKVTWSKASNAASYRVVKVLNGKKYYGKKVKTNSYKFEKSCYKDYQVYVIAYGADNKLTVGKYTTVEVGDLGVVLDPKVDKNGRVTWSEVRGAVKYKVCKVVDGKKNYGYTEGTSYTFKNVPATDYSVYVIAFDKDGNYRVGTTKNVRK